MPCNCDQLDDDLIEAGYTCYNCYACRKDNPTTEVAQMNTCPRCAKQDETVLLDNDGDPYLCDSCWEDA